MNSHTTRHHRRWIAPARASSLLVACLFIPWPTTAWAHTCTFATVGKTMLLEADCETTTPIVIPDGWTLDGKGHTITAVEAAAGAWNGAVITTEGSAAHVRNLVLTAESLACACNQKDDSDQRLRGILFDGAGGTIRNCTVRNLTMTQPCGCQEGNGIEVRSYAGDTTHDDGVTVLIQRNLVTGYQKNGIVLAGDVEAIVAENRVEGFGPTDAIAQNGIEFGMGATGLAMGNEVSGNWYIGTTWASTGILIFESDRVSVIHNILVDNQVGVGVEAWCWSAPSADGNRVAANQVFGAQVGVSIAAYNLGSYSQCAATANDNRVLLDQLTSEAGEIGVVIATGEAFCPCEDQEPEADGNLLWRNDIEGFAVPVQDEGTGTVVLGDRTNGRDSVAQVREPVAHRARSPIPRWTRTASPGL